MSSFKTGQKKRALKELFAISREYGTNPDFIIAGGGNTSVKIAGELWVKASGTELATAQESSFVALDRESLDAVLQASYPDDPEERESLVKRALLRTMLYPDRGGRPSVEASLHNLIPHRFVVHTHAWKVNGLTCSKDGMNVLRDRFAGRAVFVPYTDPGFTLAKKVEAEVNKFIAESGDAPGILFLGNHGLIVGADTPEEIRELTDQVISRCEREITPLPRGRKPGTFTRDERRNAAEIVNVIRSTLSGGGRKTTSVFRSALTDEFCASAAAFNGVAVPFTPDQIVYCGSHPLYVSAPTGRGGASKAGTPLVGDASPIVSNYQRLLHAYRNRHGFDPQVLCVDGVGLLTVGDSAASAAVKRDIFLDVMKIAHASGKSGGPRPMTAGARKFIESWEVERYRRALSAARGEGGVRTAVVTGGAQGFGEGIVRSLHSRGFNVVIADLNEKRGQALAVELASGERSSNGVVFVSTDVADEKSVGDLLTSTVLEFGGCDTFISNAGVLRAGGLEEVDSATFDFMTSVNYKGYFVCAKYASAVMKRQFEHAPHLHSDIIQINSKSGLEGSNKNFTYAGGKFGGLGLTQSFALELMPYRIKVNSICPGNFLDGPLWSDPVQGLFVQYLKAGKVPGAKSIQDVRQAYEDKVPAGRGCTVGDVMRAVYYVMEQEYETGQAVPVTGGQVMLK